MARENDVHFLQPTVFVLAPNTTQAVPQTVYGVWRAFQLIGGSCAIVGSTGVAAASGFPILANQYQFFPGPAGCFLSSFGVTSTVAVMNGLSAGASLF
ncbi:hypothetical protein [Microcystis sp. M061S2]|uniref:hypothetical protein n=1 Tax=Microcystis sp. M061S2 TaxID=2771171 RepID=UPI002589922C|nr:hypothetical protein [Microcystis sp. M061S2]MCA2656879.1 hypothetical protein [Microcystis sp. M061S2]